MNNDHPAANEDSAFIHSKASLDGSKPDADFHKLTPGQKRFFAPTGLAAMLVAEARKILAEQGSDGSDESNEGL